MCVCGRAGVLRVAPARSTAGRARSRACVLVCARVSARVLRPAPHLWPAGVRTLRGGLRTCGSSRSRICTQACPAAASPRGATTSRPPRCTRARARALSLLPGGWCRCRKSGASAAANPANRRAGEKAAAARTPAAPPLITHPQHANNTNVRSVVPPLRYSVFTALLQKTKKIPHELHGAPKPEAGTRKGAVPMHCAAY